MKQRVVWTIAGSDSSGGAGIQADLKTFQNLGVHGCSIITAVTAQNNQEINEIQYLSGESVESQMKSLQRDFLPRAIKVGMLGNISVVEKVINYLRGYSGYVVFDPILISTSGKNLFDVDLKKFLTQIKNIFSLVDVITPNISEAEKIVCRNIESNHDIEIAALEILSLGAKNVLIKGGHFQQDTFSQDYWTNGSESFWISNKRYPHKNYRGTGCTLSSAVTACLALGYNIKDSIVIAEMYVSRGIRLSEKMYQHSALLAHSGWPQEETDLPYITHQPIHQLPEKFIDCGLEQLGLYPVVDSVAWIKKLLPLGVKTIQFRIKNKYGTELENEIKESVNLATKYQAKLFINDYWELALSQGAYGVHLGQDDLNTADIKMIRKAGLRLGISTHCYYEVARAHSLNPSYLACGPIYPTTSKIMPFAPLGIAQLKRWRKTLNYPLVAIGGICTEKISDVLQTNVDGIAMISAITKAKDPIATTNRLLKMVANYVTSS
jgi:hydroxymethylpyrimidine kinase / phosphomethylpyrimidine kinase / thiamine-phosphate diphosphorylase